MGTSNYHYVNARKVYSILENWEDEGETVYPESHDIDFWKDFFKEQAGSELEDYHWVKDGHELRSFNSTYLGSFTIDKGDLEVYIHMFMRAGYYEGACLDWTIEGHFGNDFDDGDQDWKEELMYSFDYNNAGLAAIHAKNWEKSYQTIKEVLINKVEALFELVSTPYIKVAQFSNGEALYEKV